MSSAGTNAAGTNAAGTNASGTNASGTNAATTLAGATAAGITGAGPDATAGATHRHPLVAEHMARQPILVRADASLSDAAALMDAHHVHGLPVVDDAGALVGVLSQTDLNRARSTEYLWANWPGLSVRHLMTSPAVTVHRSTPLMAAARRMEQHGIHRLVVVEDGDDASPIGVLSMSDLIHALAIETHPEPRP